MKEKIDYKKINELSFEKAKFINDNYGYENIQKLNEFLKVNKTKHLTTFDELSKIINPLEIDAKKLRPTINTQKPVVIITDYSIWNRTCMIDCFNEIINRFKNFCFESRVEDTNTKYLKFAKKIESFLDTAEFYYIDNPYLKEIIFTGKIPYKVDDSKYPPSVIVIVDDEMYIIKENFLTPFNKYQMIEILSIAIMNGRPNSELAEIMDIIEKFEQKEYEK